jgi:hypothetical protein
MVQEVIDASQVPVNYQHYQLQGQGRHERDRSQSAAIHAEEDAIEQEIIAMVPNVCEAVSRFRVTHLYCIACVYVL